MSESDLITALSSGGATVVFAFVVWRSVEKLAATLREDTKEIRDLLTAMVERLSRIDERTASLEFVPARESAPRGGRAFPRAQTRPRGQPITPFVPGAKKDDEE